MSERKPVETGSFARPARAAAEGVAGAARPTRSRVPVMTPVFLSPFYCGLIFISRNFENVNCWLGSFPEAYAPLRLLAHDPFHFTPTSTRAPSFTEALLSTHV